MKRKNASITTSLIVVLGLIAGIIFSIYYGKTLQTPSNATLHMSTTVANHNLDSIVDHSDAIISGTVIEVSEPTFIGENLYKTQYVTISVGESLKGVLSANDNAIIEINSYESEENATVEDDSNIPNFIVNENVMLFLVDSGKDTYYVSGINQGAFFESNSKSTDATYSHKTIIGNDLESFSRSELLNQIKEDNP